jgi:hypothetical protein
MISTTTMTYKGYSAQVMESVRLHGEGIHHLPPGSALNVYPVDSFLSPPENWLKKGAFVVPVKPNKGLWFNFRMNDENNTAVLMTVKGCNPITGLETSGFHLDRYEGKCPKHGCDFESERFCPECGYKWPDRSYLSGSPLWWDGWVCEGAIRQFFFTEDMMRDVATHMIGKENTVPAFGFAFYSPKEPRLKVTTSQIIYNTSYHASGYSKHFEPLYSTRNNNVFYSSTTGSPNLAECDSFNSIVKSDSNLGALESLQRGVSMELPDTMVDREYGYKPQKEVSVGAGAKIRQELPQDNYPLDSWKDKPDAVMTIYFVFQEEFNAMAAGGFKDFKDCKDGMLKGLPVG